jgi:6-phosphogluconolactonase (cycloisomerase 2 family)
MHSDKLEVFSIAQNPASQSQILSARGDVLTGGITPQCIAVSPDGRTVYVANMQTEDVSILGVRSDPVDAERDPAAAEPAGAVSHRERGDADQPWRAAVLQRGHGRWRGLRELPSQRRPGHRWRAQ